MKLCSSVQLFATPWTVANRAPSSMGFSRQEYWSGLPFPSQRVFLTQGLNLGLPHLLSQSKLSWAIYLCPFQDRGNMSIEVIWKNVDLALQIYRHTMEILWMQFQTTTIKWVTGICWFPSAYKNYVYTVVYCMQYYCLKNVYLKNFFAKKYYHLNIES